jgi:hypothetical protein
VVLCCEGAGDFFFVEGLTTLWCGGGGVDLVMGRGGNGLSPWCTPTSHILLGSPGLRRALGAVMYLAVNAV